LEWEACLTILIHVDQNGDQCADATAADGAGDMGETIQLMGVAKHDVDLLLEFTQQQLTNPEFVPTVVKAISEDVESIAELCQSGIHNSFDSLTAVYS
jgi:hypothetical protein